MSRICFVLALLALATFGCKREAPVTTAECSALVERYVNLKAQEDPRLGSVPPDARDEMVRQLTAQLAATDSDMHQVVACTDELTRREYACAIRATTTKQWNDCIE